MVARAISRPIDAARSNSVTRFDLPTVEAVLAEAKSASLTWRFASLPISASKRARVPEGGFRFNRARNLFLCSRIASRSIPMSCERRSAALLLADSIAMRSVPASAVTATRCLPGCAVTRTSGENLPRLRWITDFNRCSITSWMFGPEPVRRSSIVATARYVTLLRCGTSTAETVERATSAAIRRSRRRNARRSTLVIRWRVRTLSV
jgi:hypothetical protein